MLVCSCMCVCVCAFYSILVCLWFLIVCFLKKEKGRSWVDGEVDGLGGARERKARPEYIV